MKRTKSQEFRGLREAFPSVPKDITTTLSGMEEK